MDVCRGGLIRRHADTDFPEFGNCKILGIFKFQPLDTFSNYHIFKLSHSYIHISPSPGLLVLLSFQRSTNPQR